VFTYSKEDGTRAGNMEQQLDKELKDERRNRAMEAQLGVAREIAEAYVGRTIKVLVEGSASAEELQGANVSSWEHGLMRAGADDDESTSQLEGDYLVARGEADAPDIDGRVYVRGELTVGDFAEVKIIGHTDYDLIAEPA
jgi:ribosomal protein S12 methylthiotransferase